MGEKMGIKRINGYKTALTASVTAAATSITVADASRLALAAGEFFIMTLYKGSAFEVVKVTAVAGNTLTIVRAQEGSAAQDWAAGTDLVCAPTAETYPESRAVVTSVAFSSANGHKQQFVATANAALNFAGIKQDDYIDLIVNPATFTLTWTDVNWQNGTALQLTASKLNRVLIENDGGVLKAYIVSN